MKKLTNINANRRTFFLRGSAAVGAGLAATSAAASPLVFDHTLPLKNQVSELQFVLAQMEGREAIRQLQIAYTVLLENQKYEEVIALFAEDAELIFDGVAFKGDEIKALFIESFSGHRDVRLHTGYRQNPSQQQDKIEVFVDQQTARAEFHYQVEVSIPHSDNSVVESMARLQGQHASSQWVNGYYEALYEKKVDQWQIKRLVFKV